MAEIRITKNPGNEIFRSLRYAGGQNAIIHLLNYAVINILFEVKNFSAILALSFSWFSGSLA